MNFRSVLSLLLIPAFAPASGWDSSSGVNAKRKYKDGDSIAVIGAGVSGIAAVKGLIEKGVPPSSITIIEKAALPGGKVQTVTYEGRPYELGAAVAIKGRYAAIEELAAQHQMTMRALQPTKFIDVDKGGVVPDLPPESPINAEIKKQAGFFLKKYSTDWMSINAWDGFRNIPADLEVSWKEFLEQYQERNGVGIDLLNYRLSSALGGSGYVMMQNPPFAAQILRFINPKLLMSVMAPGNVGIFDAIESGQCLNSKEMNHINLGNQVTGGFQCLWIRELERLARAGVRVRLNTEVLSIKRGSFVQLELRRNNSKKTSKQRFDHVFFTGDLRHLIGNSNHKGLLKNPSETDQKLIRAIQIYPYRSYLVRLNNFPQVNGNANYSAIFGLLPYMKNGDDKKGVLLVRPYENENVFQMYAFGGREIDDASILSDFQGDMKKIGVQFSPDHDVIAAAQWEYFPHVNPSSGLKLSDFFKGAMAQQGVGGLWFAGEVFSFGLTIEVYEQSKTFAEKFVTGELK